MKLGTSALRLIAVAGVASLALTACGGGDDSSGGGDVSEVSIGLMGDLTGENSGIVLPIKNAAELAIEEYNATNPDTKIKLIPYDSQAKPEQATALAKQAIKEDKIVGLIGPAFSGESAQVGPVLEEAKVPSVSASATNADLAESGWKYWHRVIADDDVQGAGIGNFIVNGLSAKKVFIIDDKSTYGQPLGATVKTTVEAGSASSQTDSIDAKASDYSSTVNKVKAFAPDAIFFAGYYAQGGKLLKQLREAGVDGKFLSADGSLDPGLAKGAGGKNAEGALIGCPCLIDPEGSAGDASKKFADAYKTKFGSPTAIYSAEAYDAASVFINAVKAGNVTAEDINNWIASADFPGVSKQIKFQENGEIAADDVYIYKVTGETLPLLGNAKEAKVE
ncbi:branched-chain amino acid ABC transporter substrate-binding protein [Actinocorallia sp. A-T 12471]|uniref:branched-chain amino acid ABC transporter substrate-binding protein n=1 Tax=Actinocorallia sp. A-T 12471 TaxID=3089813 RepID=UPI0029CF113C|nr:branched-chain amino acid ABC transporter substrate-binding protein [Actinocorallia sp. A-T 12471]MDX6739305.1 branched-chain amino acid ABC transporter substrate-binding protein [Actinocorallia sp. A-T 12471]